MIYRVELTSRENGSLGFVYTASRRAAMRAAREFVAGDTDDRRFEIMQAPTPRTKADVVALLNSWADHPDNG